MKHVMIVDDHEIVRRGLKEIFAAAFPKMEASEATNSRDALELVMTQDWDIILLDISIPGQCGLVVLEEMVKVLHQNGF